MDEQRETNETYNRYAARYAERYQDVELTAQLDAFAAGLPPGARVLDLGCGPGRDMAWLQARELQVIGADLSMGMLQEARTRGAENLVLADMTRLPIAVGAVSGAWLAASFHHLPRELGLPTLQGVRRLLGAGGMLYLSVKIGEGVGWQNVEEGKRFYTFYQPQGLTVLLKQAGFSIMQEWRTEDSQGRQWVDVVARIS